MSAIIFMLASVAGVIAGLFTDKWLAAMLKGMGRGEITVFSIFSHNLVINVVSILGGLLFFPIPVSILLVNGFVFGYVIMALVVHNVAPATAAVQLLYGVGPHAIPELCAMFLSCALGIRLGFERSLSALKQNLALAVVYVPIIVMLGYFAAYLEVNVSGVLIKKVIAP